MLGLLVVMALASCSGEEGIRQEEVLVPINFASVTAETEVVTRANTNLGRNFVVYGYKTINSTTTQQVFKGYDVKYTANSAGTSEDNTHNYSYVDVTPQQTIKYWDFAASEYNFWGATGGTFTDQGATLTINDLAIAKTEPDLASTVLFSALYHRSPVSTDVVQLEFKRPYAKVRVMFYTNATLTDNTFDNIQINGIKFGPESPKQIITGGSLKVSYPKKGEGPETYATTPTASADNLSFGNVQLDHTHGTASNDAVTAVPTGGTEYYFVVPNNNDAPFTLSAKIDNEDKTAVVPANFMNWKPNFVYTYIFKVSGGKYMEFYDVQIEPWHYGGGQEEEWKNW